MTKKKQQKTETLYFDPETEQKNSKIKSIGGSEYDAFNHLIADQTLRSLWLDGCDEEYTKKRYKAVVSGLTGIDPRDELEGMLAAQMLACHNAAMECHRRAMMPEQPIDNRKLNLTQANRLSRTYASLLEALNRHRGKGQQKMTVEHVHVHEGGQAIVGNIEHGGGGRQKREGTTRCASDTPFTSAGDAARRHAAGNRAKAPQCQTVDAGCTAAHHPERRRATGTPGSMETTRRSPSRPGKPFAP